jgi:hypothetical protein
MKRSTFALMIVPLALGATTITGQVRVPRGTADSKVPVTVALQVGSESYNATGQGSCRHATRGSIYNVLAQQWSVEQSDGPRSLTLTMWRPLNGSGDMMSLGINTAGKSRLVDTVKVGSQGDVKGSGTVTFAPAGNGGTFTIAATAGDGTKIAGMIKCDAFAAPAPVAGD